MYLPNHGFGRELYAYSGVSCTRVCVYVYLIKIVY